MSEEAKVQTESHEVPESNEVEDRARTMGWVPKEEFRGDPDRWRPAEEFIQRGENILPILKERNEKLTHDIAELKSTMSELREFYSKSEQRAYERAVKDLKARQKQAVAEGDTEAFEQIDREIQELSKDVQQTEEKPKTDPNKDAMFQSWVSENRWYQSNPELAAYADSMGQYIARTKSHLIGTSAYLDEVTKLVKKQHPEKFGNPARKSPSSVEGAGSVAKGKPKRSFDSLPSEAKKQCEKFEKSIKGFSRDEYVKNFDWDGYDAMRK